MINDIVVFVTTLYEHRSIIKHAIDKTKMWPGSKIEHYQVIAMLFRIRVAPESGSGSGQNPAFFPNPAKIRLRSKFRQSRMLLPDVKNAHK